MGMLSQAVFVYSVNEEDKPGLWTLVQEDSMAAWQVAFVIQLCEEGRPSVRLVIRDHFLESVLHSSC